MSSAAETEVGDRDGKWATKDGQRSAASKEKRVTSDEPNPNGWEQSVSVPLVNNIQWNFKNQVVVVTGAARSQGRAHALSFARAGADVALLDICHDLDSVPWPMSTEEDLNMTAKEVEALGVRVLPIVCDVRKESDVKSAIDAVIAQFGKIDVLINNAGVYPFYSIFDLTDQAWDEVLDTVLKGVFLCSKHVAVHMRAAGKGKIVSTGSTSAVTSVGSNSHYTAAKHGVVGFSKGLAIDLAPYGINVNVVSPGAVYTPHVSSFFQRVVAEAAEKNIDAAPNNPIELGGKWNLFNDEALHPEDITNAMMFLASDAARFITGQTLLVDQGFTIK
jgi:NAD(P)-dependent dehydrogenase (short-subunit alcohol dehydrogenase family)